MSIAAADLLRMAEALKSFSEVEDLIGIAPEVAERSSTSRAYYAAFHALKAWHDKLPEPGSNTGPNGGEHQQLINRLRNPGPGVAGELKKQSRVLAIKLDQMRTRRITADYDLDASPLSSETQAQCELAARVLGSV